ncbi:MAG: cupredoxin domain-containing protein [Candidatus Doudnabacteria bacterium]|nr:cupredoxin domain-containing protein [Candidatus Doudnabacteria bacterium]
MRSSILVPIIIVGVVVAAAAYLVMSRGAETAQERSGDVPQATGAPLTEQKPAVTSTAVPSPTPSASVQEKLVAGRFSAEEEQLGVDTQVFAVEFTDDGVQPKELSIKAGDIVLFRNASSETIRPTSESYPFSAPKGLKPGEEFQVTFAKAGTWQYGDVLAPTHSGTIVVSK